MSEYQWPVQKAWIGVMKQVRDEKLKSIEYYDRVLVGVVRRSGKVRACGHFCDVQVSLWGKKRWASGAEDRIYPFHSVVLDVGEAPKEMELTYLDFCNDGNTAAFRDKQGCIVEIVGPGKGGDGSLREIPRERWKEGWECPAS